MKAVVLAAGEGVRLRPLTETRPKVLLPLGGRPIIELLLEEARKAGVSEAVIVVRYRKEMVQEALSKADLGMKISFVEQGEERGTGAALRCAKGLLDAPFLVLAGDMVTEASAIRSVIEAHSGGITLALKKVADPRGYGVAGVSGGKVSHFEEKGPKPASDLANMSIYCMDPSVFNDLEALTISPRGEYEITDLLIGARAVICDAYWNDVAYPWDMLDANSFVLSRMEGEAGHVENSTIEGRVVVAKGARVFNSHIEGNVFIGPGSVIGPFAIIKGDTSIGAGCSIGGGTTVKNSIVMDGVNAKHLSYIGDSLVGENVNFGSGTQIANYRFDSSHVNVMTERGWVNTARKKLGAVIGDGTRFGVLSCTMPGKLIGAGCEIHSGVVVNRNVPSGKRVFTRQTIEFADAVSE